MGKNVIDVSDSNFDAEVLKSESPVLVDFTATWCGPCKQLAPVVEKIADENVGKYKVAKVDIDDCPSITQKYGVRGVPTVMVFKGGEKKVSPSLADVRVVLVAGGNIAPACAPLRLNGHPRPPSSARSPPNQLRV